MNPKIILITGAARRVGAAISEKCHQQGMNVIIHYNHSVDAANQLVTKLNKQRKNSATAIQADLFNLQQCNNLIKQAGEFDVLINNASNFFPTLLGTATEEQWTTLFDVNLKAPYFLAQAAASMLQKREGLIINISDTHANHPLKNHSIYCLTKAGLNMLTKCLAKELAPHVRVNAIAPGSVMWPEGENALDSQVKNAIMAKTALKKAGGSQAVVEACLFLLEHGSYMTGEVVTVDGGRYL